MTDNYEQRVLLWAARVLKVNSQEVKSVETDWWPKCDTCEFSGGDIDVELVDGRKFHGENSFGLFLNDIIGLDLNEDGTLTRFASGELFELKEVK